MTKKREIKRVALDDIIIRYDLYPRLPQSNIDSSQSSQAVESYKLAIEDLPPIVINQDNILIDGWHRWEAYKLMLEDIQDEFVDAEVKTSKGFDPSEVEVFVVETKSEAHLLLMAAARNSIGYVPMSRQEKRSVAERLTDKFTDEEIAEALGVPRSTVNYWTKQYRKKIKRIQKALLYEYTDKYPDKNQKEIREMIREEKDTEIPRASQSDWLKPEYRTKTEAAWREEELTPATQPGDGDMTLKEYLQDAGTLSGSVAEPAKEVTSPTPAAPTLEYICDGYKPKQKGVSDKEYMQTGCLKCKSDQSTPNPGLHHEATCRKGHVTVITGRRRDR